MNQNLKTFRMKKLEVLNKFRRLQVFHFVEQDAVVYRITPLRITELLHGCPSQRFRGPVSLEAIRPPYKNIAN